MNMAAPNESLIVKEQAELEAAPFLPDLDLPEIDKAKPKFHCSGERLFRDRPDIYKALVMLLAEPGVSIRTMCRELHVSDHTIRSVAAREQISIATVKKQVLSNITHGLRLASDRVIEMMPTASTRDALIGVGILGEKMQLLGGDVTARIDIGPKIDLGEKIRKLHEAIVARVEETKRANVIEIGLNGENSEQKALPDAPDQLAEVHRGERAIQLSSALTNMASVVTHSHGSPVVERASDESMRGEAPAREEATV
jgi:hypothetical protein